MKKQVAFKPFRLSPVDHSLPKVYIFKSLYFRGVDDTGSLSRLQDGIDRLISCLPFLSGEVVPCADIPDKVGVLQVQMPCPSLQEIPMLLVKSCPNHTWPAASTSERWRNTALLDQSYRPLPDFIPPSKPRPVLRFQANFLADGLMLCMGYNHSVFDGTGAGNILEMLADCCRANPNSILALPTNGDIESELRGLLSSPGVAVANASQEAYAINCAHTEVEPEPSSAMLYCWPFLLSSEKIECLQEACNSLLPHIVRLYSGTQSSLINQDTNWPHILSSNDVLTALLAVSIEKAREATGALGHMSRSLAMAVNLRERLKPMPRHYLGNLVTTVWVSHHRPAVKDLETMVLPVPACNRHEIDRDDLLWITHVAFRIRLGLNAINEEHIRGLIHYLHSQDDWEQIGIHFTDPIFISSWRHLKVYELDFGPTIGHAEHFEMDVGTTDGVCVVMPANTRAVGKTKKAPWDIRIVLNPEVLQALIASAIFGWAMVKDAST